MLLVLKGDLKHINNTWAISTAIINMLTKRIFMQTLYRL